MSASAHDLVEGGSLPLLPPTPEPTAAAADRPTEPTRPSKSSQPSQPTKPSPPARWGRRCVGAAVTLTMVAFPFLLTDDRSPLANLNKTEHIRLYSNGIGVGSEGTPELVPTGTQASYLPGSRVLDPGPADPEAAAAAQARAAEAQAWLAAGTIPGADGPYADMVAGALLDLHALNLDGGASVAGWSARWRYVWPRDSSFVAVAMARTGHPEEALAILDFLQGVQHRDGSFEARYLPDGSGPPDDRGIQTDGTGWVLWAADAVLATLAPAPRAEAARDMRQLVDRSTDHILDLTDGRRTLPPASSDFWEVGEARVTLGTAAPLLSGLEGAARIYADALRQPAAASAAADRAVALRAAIVTDFGPRFARYTDGRQQDAAVAFLLPPFQPTALPGALPAWRSSADAMARPAGGLAPGAGWKQDGISWTPQTTLYGLTAASVGDDAAAHAWLTWVDEHRTPSGAIPEKVLGDGSPAAVAPLAWSAACVVLAVAALEAAAEAAAPG